MSLQSVTIHGTCPGSTSRIARTNSSKFLTGQDPSSRSHSKSNAGRHENSAARTPRPTKRHYLRRSPQAGRPSKRSAEQQHTATHNTPDPHTHSTPPPPIPPHK